MDPAYIEYIEQKLQKVITPYTSPEVAKEVKNLQSLINEYKRNPSDQLMIKLLMHINQFLGY